MFNRVWHLIRHVTNPVMQIEPFVLFDMERWAMKWKISPEMRHGGRVASAPAAVITKMRTSIFFLRAGVSRRPQDTLN